MMTIPSGKKMLRSCFLISIFLSLIALSNNSLAAGADATHLLSKPKTVTPSSTQCSYHFSDTYYNAQSQTPPTAASRGADWNGNFFGAPIALQFGTTTPLTGTTPLACNGYYQVFFSVVLRNDTGLNAHDGMMSVAINVSSNDSSNLDVYGTAPRFYKNSNGSGGYASSYGGGFIMPYAGAVFNTWSQGTWGTNYFTGSMWSCCGGYSIKSYPFFMYTGSWSVSGGTPYIYWGSVPFQPKYPYGNFCYGYDRQWSNGGYCTVMNSYANVKPIQTPYNTQKTFYFKTIVYLHKGTVISPPVLRGVMTQTPYQAGLNNYVISGMSVVGGNFTVNYLHP
jgi:hypothetical protein